MTQQARVRRMNFRAGKIIADLERMGLHFHAGVLAEVLRSNAALRAMLNAAKSPAPAPATSHQEPFGSAGAGEPPLDRAA